MSPLELGLLFGGATLAALFSGMPIAFALGGVATVFMLLFMPAASVDTIAQNVYEELASITLLTIPLFILKGAAIGKSRAGKDLYDALHTWLHRIPGGLGVAVVLACGLFADRGREGFPPRPPNRACGSPAHGSPVAVFPIGGVSHPHGLSVG